MVVMSQYTVVATVPEWDQRDRLLKSMRVAHKSGAQLAVDLGVHRNTINNYLNGRTRPDRRTLIAWAMACGVSVEWLETGLDPSPEVRGPSQGRAPLPLRRRPA